MEKLLGILGDLRPDIDFEKADKLITDGVLDSYDVVALVEEISDEYKVDITPAYLLPENFDSADAIYNLIQKLQ